MGDISPVQWLLHSTAAALFKEKSHVWDSVPPELTSILNREPGYEQPLAMWDPELPEWQAYKVRVESCCREVFLLSSGWIYCRQWTLLISYVGSIVRVQPCRADNLWLLY